jgi:membrane protease YdiL (CAAX protease family)
MPDTDATTDNEDFLAFGVLAELGLAALTFLFAWIFGGRPLAAWTNDWRDPLVALTRVGIGLIATIPMLVFYSFLERLPVAPIEAIRIAVEDHLIRRLANARLTGIAALALAAGFAEEMLFRGWLQPRVINFVGYPWGVCAGIGIASLAFGLCHWLNWAYALLATLIGAYLGWLALVTNGILAPAVAHASYDFVVLWLLLRRREQKSADCRN